MVFLELAPSSRVVCNRTSTQSKIRRDEKNKQVEEFLNVCQKCVWTDQSSTAIRTCRCLRSPTDTSSYRQSSCASLQDLLCGAVVCGVAIVGGSRSYLLTRNKQTKLANTELLESTFHQLHKGWMSMFSKTKNAIIM